MAAEFHLAEYALALHLLLQHLEGLVDIVVTDENPAYGCQLEETKITSPFFGQLLGQVNACLYTRQWACRR